MGVIARCSLAVGTLTTDEAKHLQCWLRDHSGCTGAIDGLLGPESWKAFQRTLAAHWGYTGPIDGIAGPETLAAIKRAAEGWTHC